MPKHELKASSTASSKSSSSEILSAGGYCIDSSSLVRVNSKAMPLNFCEIHEGKQPLSLSDPAGGSKETIQPKDRIRAIESVDPCAQNNLLGDTHDQPSTSLSVLNLLPWIVCLIWIFTLFMSWKSKTQSN